MLFYLDHFMEIWLLPPGINLLLMIFGFSLLRVWPRVGKSFVIFALASLWVLSTPLISQKLLDNLQYSYQALPPETLAAEKNSAIVVLEAGVNMLAPEYNRPTVTENTLLRLRYAAFLHQKTGIPILVSGNDPTHASVNQADIMAEMLKTFFNVPTRWKEDQGYNTALEAIFTTNILKKAGIKKIYLVTAALHMPRSVYVFQNRGLEIVPAPTAFVSLDYPLGGISGFLPTIKTLVYSSAALHEYIGNTWYRIYYKASRFRA